VATGPSNMMDPNILRLKLTSLSIQAHYRFLPIDSSHPQ
jgi:hypothetical protein